LGSLPPIQIHDWSQVVHGLERLPSDADARVGLNGGDDGWNEHDDDYRDDFLDSMFATCWVTNPDCRKLLVVRSTI